MKIPYRWAELTLGQLQILMTTDDPLRKVCAVTGLTLEQLRAKPQSEVNEALKRIEAIPEVGRHKTKITFENRQWFKKRKKYGFICDWDDFTTGEWIDAQRYVEDFWPNAHKLMAILYRPITWENGDKYAIAKYTAKEDASIFKSMPADLFTGTMLFFWTTRNEQLTTLQSSLLDATEALISSTTNGDGISPSGLSPEKT
jgi:hypothetical protein